MKNLSSSFKILLVFENIVLYAFIIRAFFKAYKLIRKYSIVDYNINIWTMDVLNIFI